MCADRAGHAWSRRTRNVDHLLNGKPQLEPMQWVADPDLALDLLIRQCRHDRSALDVGTTRGHVPRGMPSHSCVPTTAATARCYHKKADEFRHLFNSAEITETP